MTVNLFDAHFYRANNADLTSFNDTQALQHFQTFGLNEGRIFSPFVNLNFYRSSNNDLVNLNNQQAFEHLQTFGIAEGRSFSPLVELNYYRGINSDLVSLNNQQIFEHLQTFGITEDRDFSAFVDLGFYRVNNSDLVAAGFDNRQLLEHLQLFGIREGRRFSIGFDSNFYRTVNPDLAAAGLNNAQLLEHFELFGLNEGRASSQNFDVSFYLANNPDLTAAGFNNQQALQHFQISGFREGRLTASPGSGLPLPTEIGNTLNTAFNIGVLGTSGNFNIGERVDSVDRDDFYRFTLASNSSLSLSLSNLSDDAVLSLILDRNANGQIDANEEFDITLRDRRLNPANPNIETINLTRTLGAGTYFIHVATSFPEDDTNYTLNVSTTTVLSSFGREPGNELRTNFDLGTLGTDHFPVDFPDLDLIDRSFTDFVGFFDTNDFYRFNLDSTTTFGLSLNADYINSAFVELIWDGNSNGQIEAAERFASASTIIIEPPPGLEPPDPIPPTNAFPASGGIGATLGAGTYFIRIAPGFDGANTNYTLNLYVPPAPVTTPRDPGSTLSTAVEIPSLVSGRIFTDFVGFVDTIDIYRFSLDVTSNFNLSLEGDALVDVIADSNSNGLIDNGEVFASFSDEEIISTLGAGTYFIRVTPASSRSNTNYNLNVSATPAPVTPPSNPGSTLPTALNIGTLNSSRSFTDFVGVLNPNDFYRFNLASASNFSFSFSEDLSDIALVQLILDSNNNGLVENGEVFASSSGEAVTRTLGAGNYFIRVAPTSNSANTNYTLNLSATSVPITTPSEPGNTLSTSLNIGTLSSSSFTDFVGSFDRDDFYRFNLASASIFNVSLSDQLVTDTALLQLILDTNNNGLVDNGEVFASSSGAAIATTLGTGNYFVRVAPGDNTANTNYTLNLSATPVPITTPTNDPGSTLSTALDIGTLSSSSFTDFVGFFDTNDFYRFNLDSLSNLNASLSDQLVSNSTFIELIFDNNGNSRIDPGETINTSNLGINLALLEGSYFIRIAAGINSPNTNYTLNLLATSLTTIG